ncbi:MAG: hypothetical protein AVDCRST_MAG67-845 [uncultured Solirubrobacteraceae bacterium]|uniref:Uncharacterized protein n=1 Tax=uncultured Solirubrobacteraceae bacterium TaxID=1162706 RepID=A0A6J4RSL7_9ACTN|nr:MAG: hypothetical protein AVDCRST_MAG67-845 [uncultured Solirubrobacteraceae bacterium]
MSAFPTQTENAPNAVLSLVLGIIGVVACSLCAPFAWKLGKDAEAAVDASGGTLGGRGLATAGKILGIIGTVLLVIGVVILVLVLAGTGIALF